MSSSQRGVSRQVMLRFFLVPLQQVAPPVAVEAVLKAVEARCGDDAVWQGIPGVDNSLAEAVLPDVESAVLFLESL